MHQHPIIRQELNRLHVVDLKRDGAQQPVPSSRPEQHRRPRVLGFRLHLVRLPRFRLAARQRG